MTVQYLLDTNILSVMMRGPADDIERRIRQVGPENVWTSLVVAGELRFGAIRRGSARLIREVERVLTLVPVVALEPPVDQVWGGLRFDLERRGTPIGANDLFIAAHAVARGSVLVSDNVREFARVPGLIVENWLRDEAATAG